VVKRGTAWSAREAGFTHITELDQWESSKIGNLEITAAPAKHGVTENTYVLESNGLTVFFGGDTILIPELTEVARRFPITSSWLQKSNKRCRTLSKARVSKHFLRRNRWLSSSLSITG
jgi:hypothetical protein